MVTPGLLPLPLLLPVLLSLLRLLLPRRRRRRRRTKLAHSWRAGAANQS